MSGPVPFTPCAACPVRSRGYRCLAEPRPNGRRAMPRACENYARDPDTWGPELRRWAAANGPRALPYPDGDCYVAPIREDAFGGRPRWGDRPWEGCAARRPWQYPAWATLAHLDQPDLLLAVVETLRRQTVRPFVHVVDTGSTRAVRDRLAELERSCEDVQVDYLRPRGWTSTSFPVAVACDLAFASVPPGVEYCYGTHVDVFLGRPDYLEFLAARCDARTPVVGWQMSPRLGWPDDLWARMPSHTATMYHMPTMRRIGATWSMVAAGERLGVGPEAFFSFAFPDTESNLGLGLIRAGIGMRWLEPDGTDPGRPGPGERPSWLCLGPERNTPYGNRWFRHERSYTAHATYDDSRRGEARRKVVLHVAATALARARTWPVAPWPPPGPPSPAGPGPGPPDWPGAWNGPPAPTIDPAEAKRLRRAHKPRGSLADAVAARRASTSPGHR